MAWIILDTQITQDNIIKSIIRALEPLDIGITNVSLSVGMDDTRVVIEGVCLGEGSIVMTRPEGI